MPYNSRTYPVFATDAFHDTALASAADVELLRRHWQAVLHFQQTGDASLLLPLAGSQVQTGDGQTLTLRTEPSAIRAIGVTFLVDPEALQWEEPNP